MSGCFFGSDSGAVLLYTYVLCAGPSLGLDRHSAFGSGSLFGLVSCWVESLYIYMYIWLLRGFGFPRGDFSEWPVFIGPAEIRPGSPMYGPIPSHILPPYSKHIGSHLRDVPSKGAHPLGSCFRVRLGFVFRSSSFSNRPFLFDFGSYPFSTSDRPSEVPVVAGSVPSLVVSFVVVLGLSFYALLLSVAVSVLVSRLVRSCACAGARQISCASRWEIQVPTSRTRRFFSQR